MCAPGLDWRLVSDEASLAVCAMTASAARATGLLAAGVSAAPVAIWTSDDGTAWQHVPEGGRVRVEASVRGDYVLVRLVNEGPAIPPDVAPRVFEPFFTTKPSGSGLGLAAVRRALEDVGGHVELESAKDAVSFALWLRRAEADG